MTTPAAGPMRTRALTLLLFLGLSTTTALAASLSGGERIAGLKEALTQGTKVAIDQLGKPDGFLGNPEVKIPLPKPLKKAEKAMRLLGLRKQSDELVVAMNRAAEAAMPEAKAVLVDAVKKMTVQDAAAILSGPDDAATQYFKRTSTPQLREKLLPIVQRTTGKVGVAHKYNSLAGKLSDAGIVKPEQASIESYVTDKALDGLFLMIAKEEAAIRKNPLGQASSILKKVFGALGK